MSSINTEYSLIEWLLFFNKKVNTTKLKKSLFGKTILITGASYGIGENLAYLLSFKNTNLILVGRTTEKLTIVKQKVEEKYGNAEIFSADLRKDDEIDSLIQYLKQKNVDIFVNNAGKSIRRSIINSLDRYHDFKRTMDINYHAPVKLCLALIPILEKNKGHLINISAVNVLLPPAPMWAAYQSSKSAFDQWFRSVSPELRARKIEMSTIYFPLVKTRMIEPTEVYKKAPAMNVIHASNIIASLIISKKRRYKPWWVVLVEFSSLIFRKPFEYFIDFKYRK